MKKWLKIGGMGCASVVLLVVLFYFSGYLIPAEMELKGPRKQKAKTAK